MTRTGATGAQSGTLAPGSRSSESCRAGEQICPPAAHTAKTAGSPRLPPALGSECRGERSADGRIAAPTGRVATWRSTAITRRWLAVGRPQCPVPSHGSMVPEGNRPARPLRGNGQSGPPSRREDGPLNGAGRPDSRPRRGATEDAEIRGPCQFSAGFGRAVRVAPRRR